MKLCDLLQEQAESLRAGRDFAVVTIVRSENLARTSGKMVVYADGSISGTVGGGMWEQAAINDAKKALISGEMSSSPTTSTRSLPRPVSSAAAP